MTRKRLALLLIGLAAAAVVGTGVVLVTSWQPVHPGIASERPAPDLAPLDRILDEDGTAAKLLPTDHRAGTAVWLVRHGSRAVAANATCSVCHPSKRCATCHQTPMPHVAGWSKAHGKAVLATGSQACLRCHDEGAGTTKTLVSLGDKLSCRGCHALPMPHASTWVARGHRVAARASTAVCATCHTRATCETCHQSDQVSSCRTCHTSKALAISRPKGHATSQCLTCHQRQPRIIGPGPGHRTVPVCQRCHTPGKLVPLVKVRSQRDWAGTNGLGFTTWAKRGVHSASELVQCSSCHTPHSAEKVAFPVGVSPRSKSCALSCHSWLKGDVVSRGFLNASGDPEATTYRGPISPELLLKNGTTKHSTVVYAQNGCAGKCHQGPHGAVTMCISCHDWKSLSPGNLHATHVSLVTAERSAADPANANGQQICFYCHQPGTQGVQPGNTLWRRACYNCHLSAHNPEVPYWKLPGAP